MGKHFYSRRPVRVTAALVATALVASAATAQRVEVAFDDFNDVPLQPFDVANTSVGDGTDWTNLIPGWQIINAPEHEATEADAYNGWVALDVDSWIDEQGAQGGGTRGAGRSRMRLGVANNTALVADPDAWDDFPPPGRGDQGFNSFVQRTYDISGANLAGLELSFDWDFVTEDNQIGFADVSFDGGTSWQTLFTVASSNWTGDPVWGAFAFPDQLSWSTNPGDDVVYSAFPAGDGSPVVASMSEGIFLSGVDFTPPDGATSMIVRFGVVLSGNDWWFAVDNVGLTDGASLNEFEDFEGLTLLPFPEGGVGQPPGDGTDYTQEIPNWVIDNSGLLTESLEGAFNGWALLDVQSWTNQQGGQNRTFLNEISIFGERNTALVADPDAHDDFDVELPDGDPLEDLKEFNSYVSRTYDLTDFKNTTVRISFDWETRVESSQRALAEASFDGGVTWVTLLDVDSDDEAKLTAVAPFLFLGDDTYATFADVQTFEFGGSGSALPAINSNSMILRFGLIDAENNWWFAVDNILVEAETQNFVLGDANGDGVLDFGDLDPFVMALLDPAAFSALFPSVNPAEVMDFDADGAFTFGDIDGFTRTLLE